MPGSISQRSTHDRRAPRRRRKTTMPNPSLVRGTLVCAVPLLLAACATQPSTDTLLRTGAPRDTAVSDALGKSGDATAERARIFRGSGVVIKGQQPGGIVGA